MPRRQSLSAAILEACMRAADRGDLRAAERVVDTLLDERRPEDWLPLARRYAEMVFAGEDTWRADVVVDQFLYSDGCGGWKDPRATGPDPRWAIRQMRSMARSGSADAMYSLYVAYWRGAGVRRDIDAAERWARRAARAGDVPVHGPSGMSAGLGIPLRAALQACSR